MILKNNLISLVEDIETKLIFVETQFLNKYRYYWLQKPLIWN